MTVVTAKNRPEKPPQDGDSRRLGVADGVVLKDAGKHARWGWCDPESKRSMTRIANLKRLGYRPATEADVVDMRDAYSEPDGTIHKGDQILMVCDRDGVESRDTAQRRERESVERKQVKAIEDGAGIDTDRDLHHQRVRGREVDLA